MVGLMNNGTRTQTNRPGYGRFAPMTTPGASLRSTMPTTLAHWVNLASGMGIAGAGARLVIAGPAQFQLRVPTRRRC
jgi:hypothetical protein